MDFNDFRSIMTVVSLLTFAGIVAWAYSGKRRQAFEEAARLPFAQEELEAAGLQPREGKAS